MSYEVRFRPAAERDLQALPKDVRQRIWEQVTGLGDNPKPPKSQALHGDLAGLRRLRVGDYRVAYVVDEAAHIVRIAGIRPGCLNSGLHRLGLQ